MTTNSTSSSFFLARPSQSLYMHIKNMLTEVVMYKHQSQSCINLKDSLELEELVDFFYKTLIISHDFGKINPFYQKKFRKIQTDNIKLTYHTQIGALLVIILQEEIIKHIVDEELIKEVNMNLVAIVFSILNHHKKGYLPNSLLDGLMKSGTEMLYRYLFEIQQEILSYSNDIKPVEEILKEYFSPLLEGNSLLEKLFPLAIKTFLSIDDEEEISEYFYDFEEIWKGLRTDNRLFHLVLNYYSLLCDLDEWDAKTHIEDTDKHQFSFENEYIEINGDIVENFRKNKFDPIKDDEEDLLLRLKQDLWDDVNNFLNTKDLKNKLISVAYPTGSGKTISFLQLAFNLREKFKKEHGEKVKIVYCLPFISITDQVAKVMLEVLSVKYGNIDEKDMFQTDLLAIHHHLAEAEWSYFSEEEEKDETNFGKLTDYIYLWNSNIILTTFVSFWNTFFGGKKRNFLRLHRINNSIIILDEIQSLPIEYWQLISSFLHQLCRIANCTIIIGSATNPKAISTKYEWNKYPAELEEIKHEYVDKGLNRYSIRYNKERKTLGAFAQECVDFLKQNKSKSVMFVLNTKESARLFFNYLGENFPCNYMHFLSSAVTYQDRKRILDIIDNKDNKKILVCTQVIEAGVDVSFDIVFRDLAPLDSIVQVAGRCNRYNKEKGKVYVVELTIPDTTQVVYSTMVYDQILIEQTRKILERKKIIEEIALKDLIDEYYNVLSLDDHKKDTKKAVEEFNSLYLENLSRKFELIKVYEPDTLVFCKNASELIRLISTTDSLKNKEIFRKIRGKAISVSNTILNLIKEQVSSNSLEIIIKSKHANIWGVSLEGNKWLYTENGGLNIPKLRGKEDLFLNEQENREM